MVLLFYKTCRYNHLFLFKAKSAARRPRWEVMLCIFEQIMQDVGEDAAGEVVIDLNGGIDAVVELEANECAIGLNGDCGMGSVGLKGANALD